jgi:MFS family permease
VISTLFPHLPYQDLAAYSWSLVIAGLFLGALVVVGLYPVALAAAAFLVPLLMTIYMVAVDVFEDDGVGVVLATVAWGVVAGLVVGIVERQFLPAGTATGVGAGTAPILRPGPLLLRGVVLPVIDVVVMFLAPLLLFRTQRLHDLLDGIVFGTAAATTYVGARLLVDTAPLFSAGLAPGGSTLPWLIRLISAGILQPVLAGSVIGAFAGTVWLRRHAGSVNLPSIGAAGDVRIAALLAALALVAVAISRLLLPESGALLVSLVVTGGALIWLRRVIHLGLVHELHDGTTGDAIPCANCGRETSHMRFCGACGIALRALPKGRAPRAVAQ